MRIDLHVHTNRYSKCSHISPQEMAESAIAAGLDGVVITEHNTIWSAEELDEFRQQYPKLTILRAFEVSAADKHDVLVYGVYDPSRFYVGMPVRAAVDTAHAMGGYAVLAHPFRYVEQIKPEVWESPFDAVETCSINIDPLQHQLYLDLAKRMAVPYVHNSDGHYNISLGGYYNEFHVQVSNEAELLAALRNKAFTPMVQQDLLQPALDFRAERVAERLQRLIARGITDVDGLYAKVGGSRDRIRAVLESVALNA